MAMAAAKIAVRIKGQATCLHHKGRQLELYCETCQELACLKCVTGIHKGHLLCDLSVITNQKEEDIINFIDRTEQNELVQNRKEIASIDVLLQGNERTFEKLSTQLRMQTEELKQDLDKLTVETLSLYKKMKEDNVKIIQKYKQDLEMYGRQLKEQIHECLTALEQGSQIEIYDTECEIDSQIHHPVGPVLNSVIFTPNKKPRNYLELAVGNVVTCHGRLSTDQETLAKCTISDDQQRSSTAQEPYGNGGKVETRIKLPTHGKVVEDWESPCDIWSICPTSDGQAWTSNYSETLTLLDRWKGTVMHEVTHTNGIKDISMSPTTYGLWAIDYKNNILELVSGQLSERFKTEDSLVCICVTSTNHIIVGSSNRISKYTSQGQMVLTTLAAGTGKPLLCSPWRITECPITSNVAVIDDNKESDGGDGKKHVVVMDTDFQRLFAYRCNIPRAYQQTSQTGQQPFNPNGVVYDSQGNILIADFNNSTVIILSGEGGKVLRILQTDTGRKALAVGIDSQDLCWSVFYSMPREDFIVKIIQYSSKP